MKIVLYRRFLMHDIRQLATRYASARFEKGEKRADAQVGLDDSDIEMMERFIHTGVGLLRKKLRKVITEFVQDDDDMQMTRSQIDDTSDIDNATEGNTGWAFKLKETANDDTTIDGFAMAKLMHWFVVKFAMWQWLQMWSPSEAQIAKAELDELGEELDNLTWDFSMSMPMKIHKPKRTLSTTEITYTYESE